jgi:hypothetical protein
MYVKAIIITDNNWQFVISSIIQFSSWAHRWVPLLAQVTVVPLLHYRFKGKQNCIGYIILLQRHRKIVKIVLITSLPLLTHKENVPVNGENKFSVMATNSFVNNGRYKKLSHRYLQDCKFLLPASEFIGLNSRKIIK